jgi:hypothetical protein
MNQDGGIIEIRIIPTMQFVTMEIMGRNIHRSKKKVVVSVKDKQSKLQ